MSDLFFWPFAKKCRSKAANIVLKIGAYLECLSRLLKSANTHKLGLCKSKICYIKRVPWIRMMKQLHACKFECVVQRALCIL
jgi:hypothetical protein